ncbi:MAG TPA: hypothetical protein VGF24_21035 [Vicinamibacterales bacterium]
MYLLSNFEERARRRSMLRAVQAAREPSDAHRVILDALPEDVSGVLTTTDVESIRQRLCHQAAPAQSVFTKADVIGAVGVCLLVFLSTLPIVIPFWVTHNLSAALRALHSVASTNRDQGRRRTTGRPSTKHEAPRTYWRL